MIKFLKSLFKSKCKHEWVPYGPKREVPQDSIAIQKMYCKKCMCKKTDYTYLGRRNNG